MLCLNTVSSTTTTSRRRLRADLHDLEVKASFNSLLKKYSGKVAYSNGQLVYGALRPVTHNLEAEFDATSALHSS